MLLNNEWSRMRFRKESRSFWKQMKMNSQQYKTHRTQQSTPEREVHRDTGLPKKDRNISSEEPYTTPTRTGGTTTKTAQSK